jgi:nucleoid DNA-binding protein
LAGGTQNVGFFRPQVVAACRGKPEVAAISLQPREQDQERTQDMSETPTTTNKPMTKTEIVAALAESTGMSKQQVTDFFEELTKLIAKNLEEGSPGVFNIPGLMKVRVVRKPAVPERKGINPFTKEETVFKAKPPQNVVKISALKRLKDLV